jgi:hypothetical protein
LIPFRRPCAKPAAGIMTATRAAITNHFMNLFIINYLLGPPRRAGVIKVSML